MYGNLVVDIYFCTGFTCCGQPDNDLKYVWILWIIDFESHHLIKFNMLCTRCQLNVFLFLLKYQKVYVHLHRVWICHKSTKPIFIIFYCNKISSKIHLWTRLFMKHISATRQYKVILMIKIQQTVMKQAMNITFSWMSSSTSSKYTSDIFINVLVNIYQRQL